MLLASPLGSNLTITEYTPKEFFIRLVGSVLKPDEYYDENQRDKKKWNPAGFQLDKPSSSDVTLRMIIKWRRPSLLNVYFGLSLSSHVSLYHVTMALSKDTSHSKVADCRSRTTMFWMRLVKCICSAKERWCKIVG